MVVYVTICIEIVFLSKICYFIYSDSERKCSR